MEREEQKLLMKEVAREAATEAVEHTLISLGIDDPIKFQKDAAFTRDLREGTEIVKRKTVIGAIMLVLAGIVSLAWMALKDYIGFGG